MKDRNKAIKSTVLSLYSFSQNSNEIIEFLKSLEESDIEDVLQKITNAHQRYCVNCGRPYATQKTNSPIEGFCPDCQTDERQKELDRLNRHRLRARRYGLPDTLTFKEWIKTLEHFNFKCAYCETVKFNDLEHFIPLSRCEKGGRYGTTLNNVVPSCKACNYKKKRKNPKVKSSRRYIRIPEAQLVKVERYLDIISK